MHFYEISKDVFRLFSQNAIHSGIHVGTIIFLGKRKANDLKYNFKNV